MLTDIRAASNGKDGHIHIRQQNGGILIMKLVPLGDRVVIKALVAEETTKSGIVLPGQAKEKPSAGRSSCSRTWWSC